MPQYYYFETRPHYIPNVPPASVSHYDKQNDVDTDCTNITYEKIDYATGYHTVASARLGPGKTHACYVIVNGALEFYTYEWNFLSANDMIADDAWIGGYSNISQDWIEYNQRQGIYESLTGIVLTDDPNLGVDGMVILNVPVFNHPNDAANYINGDSWDNAINVMGDDPYANWTVGFTNSNDTVYSLACSVPAFYDPDSEYYGKNEVATIDLQAIYVIGETPTSIYHTSYPYGQTWQGQLSSIIGQSGMNIANQIAVGAASLLDLDRITLVFSVSIPTDSDPYVLPRGRVVFDHEEVEDYGFLDPIHGDTINFKSGVVLDDSDSDIDNPDPEDEESDDITDPSVSDVTGTGLLTKTYVMTPQEAQGVGQFIWGASFIQNIRLLNNSPIENIVSCKLFPFDLVGTAENVQIGNVDTGTASQKIAQNIITHTSNALLIPHFYKGQCDNMEFLDYDPYTKVEIFLPFIGIKELPTDLIMGKNIKLKWIVDLTCGTLETDVLIEYKSGKYCPLYIFNSQCGADIPLTAQNLSQVQAAYIGNAISGGVSLASGNVAGVMQSLAGAAMTQYHSQSSGTPSPGTALQGYLKPYVRITRPDAKIVGSSMDGDDIDEPCFMYRRLMGSPLYQVKNLGSLMGYTEIENPQIVIPGALGVEIEEVNRLLSDGVILKYPDIIGA